MNKLLTDRVFYYLICRQALLRGSAAGNALCLIIFGIYSAFFCCVNKVNIILFQNMQAYFEGPGPPSRTDIQGALLLCVC